MSLVEIDSQERYVPIAFKEKWYQPIGLIGKINNHDVSFVLSANGSLPRLIISDLKSGVLIEKYYISLDELKEGQSKEGTLNYIRRYAIQTGEAMGKINNLENICEEALQNNVRRLGPVPPIKIYEGDLDE